MKKFITILLILFLPVISKAQTRQAKNTTDTSTEKNQAFANQGEYEKSQAKRIFKLEYKKQFFEKYKGAIRTLDENHISYGKALIEIYNCDKKLKPIFTNGLFYPQILKTDTLQISVLEEQTFLSNSPKIKRFKFWLYTKGLLNPTVYFIELTNNKATKNSSLIDFFKGSRLTFAKKAWLII
jgi:hypothetical protein